MTHTDPMDRDRQQAEANAILDSPPPGLLAWLDAENLVLEDADLSENWTYGGMASSLRKHGLLETMEAWRKEQAKRFKELGITNRERVAAKVIYRFAVAKSRQWQSSKTKRKKDTELDSLPADLRWVYEHPALNVLMDPESDQWKAQIAAYEEKRPAPSNGARNYLANCLDDKSTRKKLFEEVRTFLLESRKRKKEAPNQAEQEGKQQILDMRAELEKMRGKAV